MLAPGVLTPFKSLLYETFLKSQFEERPFIL